MKKMKQFKLIYAFALLGSIAACDDDDDNNSNNNELQQADERFVEKASLSNITEIDFGSMAATNASSEIVMSFGEHMVAEHTTAQEELESLGEKFEDVDWPSELDPQHQQLKEQLMGLSGFAFDSAYMTSQVMDHEATLTLFDNALDSAENEEVRAYINKYRPHIEEHLER